MIADLNVNLDVVLVHDTALADVTRWVIFLASIVTGALLLRLYLSHRTGRMNAWAGIGAVGTYWAVAYAQPLALARPGDDLAAINVVVLAVITSSLIGTLQAMDIRLFRHDRVTG